MLIPARQNFTAYRGFDFTQSFSVICSGTALDLSSYQAQMIVGPEIELNSNRPGLTLNGNTITVTITGSATSQVYVSWPYYLSLVGSGIQGPVLNGQINFVSPYTQQIATKVPIQLNITNLGVVQLTV